MIPTLTLGDFTEYLFFQISTLILLQSENMFYIVWSILNLLSFAFYPRICSIFVTGTCALFLTMPFEELEFQILM